MKKGLVLTLVLVLFGNVALAGSTNYYKLNQYNSRGQKTGYTKVYYKGDRSNVKKIEKYNTKGKRTELYR